MSDDYYSDNPGPAAGAPPEAGAPSPEAPPPEDKAEDGGDHTALIPKALLAGKDFKVGEEVVFEIKAMHGDEVEIAYAKDKGGGEEGGGEATAPPGGGDSEMNSMMY